MAACEWGHEDIAKLLLSRSDFQVNLAGRGAIITMALIIAIMYGCEGSAKPQLAHPAIGMNAKGNQR